MHICHGFFFFFFFPFSGFFFRAGTRYMDNSTTRCSKPPMQFPCCECAIFCCCFYFLFPLESSIAMPHHSCFCTLETKQSLLSDRCMLPLLLSGWQPMACSHHQCLLVAPVAVPPHNDRNFISQRLVKGISLKRTVFFCFLQTKSTNSQQMCNPYLSGQNRLLYC